MATVRATHRCFDFLELMTARWLAQAGPYGTSKMAALGIAEALHTELQVAKVKATSSRMCSFHTGTQRPPYIKLASAHLSGLPPLTFTGHMVVLVPLTTAPHVL